MADALASSPARGRILSSLRDGVAGALAALHGRRDEAVAAFTRSLAFRYLRLDRATMQALFATMVGRDVPEGREASDAAFDVLAAVGANAYLDLYAAGMPPSAARLAAGS